MTVIELCRRIRWTVAASTPIANRSVAHECRRSCNRIVRTPARRHSDSNARLTFRGSSGVPFLVVNTNPSVLPCATTELASCSLRCCRRTLTSSSGNGTDAAEDSVFTSRNANSVPTRDKAVLMSTDPPVRSTFASEGRVPRLCAAQSPGLPPTVRTSDPHGPCREICAPHPLSMA